VGSVPRSRVWRTEEAREYLRSDGAVCSDLLGPGTEGRDEAGGRAVVVVELDEKVVDEIDCLPDRGVGVRALGGGRDVVLFGSGGVFTAELGDEFWPAVGVPVFVV